MLSFKDFLSCRPTEFADEDVLMFESRYIESEKQMKKFKGLKRFSLSAKVVDDEIFYFRCLLLSYMLSSCCGVCVIALYCAFFFITWRCI